MRDSILLAVSCGSLLAACGGEVPPPEAPTPPPVPVASATATTVATSTASAPKPDAKPDPDCEGAACYALGLERDEKGEHEKARSAFARGCEGPTAHAKSCTAFALLLAKGEGGPKDEAKAARLSDKSCADDPAGCLVHGLLARDGLGTPKDEARAISDFDKACKAGSKAACGARDELRGSGATASASSGGGDKDDADFTANGMTIEGLEIGTLKCKLGGGGLGLLGAIVVGKSLSARKDAMQKCTKKPIDVTVKWTNAGSTVKDVKVDAPDKAVEACVTKALAGAPATVPGTCTAVVHLKP